MRYFEENFDTGEIVEYERHGSCNQCGQCCMTAGHTAFYNDRAAPLSLTPKQDGLSEPADSDESGDEEVGTWYRLELESGDYYQMRPQPANTDTEPVCSALSLESGLPFCSVHTVKQPICTVWPIHPSQVAMHDLCSYSFVEIDRYTKGE